MKVVFLICISVIAIFFVGCNASPDGTVSVSEGSAAQSSYKKTVEVYKYSGARQCGDDGISAEEMAVELINEDIPVISFYCDVDGYFHIAVCGAETGRINVFEIPEDDLQAAIELGFTSIEELTDRSQDE